MKDVLLLVGAGQIGMAIARRIGFDKKIIIGDKNLVNAKKIADIMYNAGFDVNYLEVDLADRISIKNYIQEAQKYGQIGMLINAAGVSPSQASIETILKVDLYGTAVLLEEVGKVIKPYGTGVTISSQSGHRMEALGSEIDEQLATTDCENLLSLSVLQVENIKDNLLQKKKNRIFENTVLIVNYFIKCCYRALWSCSAIFSLATESISFIRFNWFTSLIPASQSIATIFTPSCVRMSSRIIPFPVM